MPKNTSAIDLDARSKVLGVSVNRLTMNQTVEAMRQLISSGNQHRHLAVNAAKLVEAYEHPDRASLFNGASIISADGQAVVWASRLLGTPLPERVAGIDLMDRLVELSVSEGYGLYLLGAKPEVVSTVAHHFERRGAKVVGYHDGYWRQSKSDEEMVSEIAACKPDVLFVAIPSPMKEDFIALHMNGMGVPLSVGVGGSFDVIAGVVRRSPVMLQRLGLEWLYRLIQEPRRMFKRYLIGNTKFICYVIKARVFRA